MKKQKENSHEGITWSEMENKMYKLKRSIESFRFQDEDENEYEI